MERRERVRKLDSGVGTWREVRRRGREIVVSGVHSFAANDLLSYASAIAFQVLFALVPLSLAGLALLGFLGLEEVWHAEIAPVVREHVQEDAFSVMDRTVDQILGEKRALWLTFGAVLALWEVSGAVRTVIAPLNLVYGAREERPWWRRLLVSFALALAIGPLVLLAASVIHLLPQLTQRLDLGVGFGVVSGVARWVVAALLLALAVWLLIRFTPSETQSFAWAGLGSAFVVGSWILASLAFGFYLTSIADYRSVFGSLTSVIVLMTYLYLSAVALLFGVQLDACVRAQVDDEARRSGRPAR